MYGRGVGTSGHLRLLPPSAATGEQCERTGGLSLPEGL